MIPANVLAGCGHVTAAPDACLACGVPPTRMVEELRDLAASWSRAAAVFAEQAMAVPAGYERSVRKRRAEINRRHAKAIVSLLKRHGYAKEGT